MSTVKEAPDKASLFDNLLNKPHVVRRKVATTGLDSPLPPILGIQEVGIPEIVEPSVNAHKTAGKRSPVSMLPPKPLKEASPSVESVYSYAGAKVRKNLLWEDVSVTEALPAVVIEELENQKAVEKAKMLARRVDTPVTRKQPLDARAKLIVASLPKQVRPMEICINFPHIMNLIGMSWGNPKDFVKTLEDLLVDDRRDRQGFPFAVVAELTELREHYFSAIRPEARGMWDRL